MIAPNWRKEVQNYVSPTVVVNDATTGIAQSLQLGVLNIVWHMVAGRDAKIHLAQSQRLHPRSSAWLMGAANVARRIIARRVPSGVPNFVSHMAESEVNVFLATKLLNVHTLVGIVDKSQKRMQTNLLFCVARSTLFSSGFTETSRTI